MEGTTLVVGASGQMGGAIAQGLLARGAPVRALTRTPEKLAALASAGAEVVAGDLRDADSLAAACRGVRRVVTTAHSSDGKGATAPELVDGAGNRSLVDAAKAAGVEHFVFTSNILARADSPVDYYRVKYDAEQYLRASGVPFTILRAAPLMETLVMLVGRQVATKGRGMVFGRGRNPISLVAIADVARVAVLALGEPATRGQALAIGGPEALTIRQVVETFARVLDRPIAVRSLPLPALRFLGVVLRPINPVASRRMAQMIVADTAPQVVDMTETLRLLPQAAPATRVEDFVRAHFAPAVVAPA